MIELIVQIVLMVALILVSLFILLVFLCIAFSGVIASTSSQYRHDSKRDERNKKDGIDSK